MIVKCEQCQTRFKIPDDKVTEKGVKVRCTKCQHTFRVKREGAAPVTTQVPAVAAVTQQVPAVHTVATAQYPAIANGPTEQLPKMTQDPFAKFGAAPGPTDSEATRPGMYAFGVEASRGPPQPLQPSFAAQRDVAPEIFESPTRVGARPKPIPHDTVITPRAARPPEPAPAPAPPSSEPFDFAQVLNDAPLAPAAPEAGAGPFDFAASAPGAFDFAAPDSGQPAAGGFDPAAPDGGGYDYAAAEAAQAAYDPGQAAPGGYDPAGQVGFDPMQAAPVAYPGPQPEVAPVNRAAGAFDFSGPGDVTAASGSPFDFAAAAPSAEAFNFSAPPLPPPPVPTSAPRRAAAAPLPELAFEPPAPRAPAPASDPFAALSDPGALTVPEIPAAMEPPRPMVAPPPSAPSVFGLEGGDFVPPDDLLGMVPPPPPQKAGLAGLENLAELPGSGDFESDTAMRSQLFEMPAKAAAATESAQPLEPSTLAASAAAPQSPASPSMPTVSPDALEVPRLRRVGGLIFNIVIATVLVAVLMITGTVYLSEGKVELASFSWRRLKGTLSTPNEWVALDVSNGLYDTRAGRPVFYVRGEVKNRNPGPMRVKVRAQLLEGDNTITQAEAWAGAAATPEDLFGITVADDVQRLLAKLAKTAPDLAAGEQRQFLIPFYEYPSDLAGYRIKVTVIGAGKAETAAR